MSVRVVQISLMNIPELDDEESSPRPPAYPPPPLVQEQDRVSSEVQRILSRRSERRLSSSQEEDFLKRLSRTSASMSDYGTVTPRQAPVSSSFQPAHFRQASNPKTSAFSSRSSNLEANNNNNNPDDADRKSAQLWNTMVSSAEKRRHNNF